MLALKYYIKEITIQMDELRQLLHELNINEQPVQGKNNTWIIEIEDSNEYGIYYSKLEKSTILEQDEESSNVTIDGSTIQYYADKYNALVVLLADWSEDTYRLAIKMMGK